MSDSDGSFLGSEEILNLSGWTSMSTLGGFRLNVSPVDSRSDHVVLTLHNFPLTFDAQRFDVFCGEDRVLMAHIWNFAMQQRMHHRVRRATVVTPVYHEYFEGLELSSIVDTCTISAFDLFTHKPVEVPGDIVISLEWETY